MKRAAEDNHDVQMDILKNFSNEFSNNSFENAAVQLVVKKD
jgi:hypothetical protein